MSKVIKEGVRNCSTAVYPIVLKKSTWPSACGLDLRWATVNWMILESRCAECTVVVHRRCAEPKQRTAFCMWRLYFALPGEIKMLGYLRCTGYPLAVDYCTNYADSRCQPQFDTCVKESPAAPRLCSAFPGKYSWPGRLCAEQVTRSSPGKPKDGAYAVRVRRGD